MGKDVWRKDTLMLLIIGFFIGGVTFYYLFNIPQRDVKSAKVDTEITVTALVKEFLSNQELAYEKYLNIQGDSKILKVEGPVSHIFRDYKGQVTVLLKSANDKAGVTCIFLPSNLDLENIIKVGDIIRVRGVVRSGANYDSDLKVYEDVVMEKCGLVTQA